MSLPRFLVAPGAIAGTEVTLRGEELRHLRARRLRVGSAVIVCDGEGQERRGTVRDLDQQRAVVVLAQADTIAETSAVRLTLAQAALKVDKLDLVIEKATELGVREIVIFVSQRTVRVPRSERRARWERVARSAAKQSQRRSIPRILGPIPFEDVLARRTEECRLFFWENASPADGSPWHRSPPPGSVLSVVGPEGGFSADEASAAAANGFQPVHLGLRPLRAETAAIVALGLCQFLWGELQPRS